MDAGCSATKYDNEPGPCSSRSSGTALWGTSPRQRDCDVRASVRPERRTTTVPRDLSSPLSQALTFGGPKRLSGRPGALRVAE